MLSERFRTVLATLTHTIEQLPPEEQERAAGQLEEWLVEQEWEKFFASERGNHLIADILANHQREQQTGTIDDGDW